MADDSMLLNLLLNAAGALSDDEKAKRLLELKNEYEQIKALHDQTVAAIAENRDAIGTARAERAALAKEKAELDTARAKLDEDTKSLGVQVADIHRKQAELNQIQDLWHATRRTAEDDLRQREAAVTAREHDVADRSLSLSDREAAVALRESKMDEVEGHAHRLIASLA